MRDLRDERGQAVTETMLASWIVILFVAAIYQVFLANQTVYRSLAAGHTELMLDAFSWNCTSHDLPFAPPGPGCDYQGGLSRIVALGEPAKVIYNRYAVPEIFMPVVGLFAERAASRFSSDQTTVYGRLTRAIYSSHRIPPFDTVDTLRLWSGSALQQEPDPGCGIEPPGGGIGPASSGIEPPGGIKPPGGGIQPPGGIVDPSGGNDSGKGERPSCKRTKAGAGPYLPLSDAFKHMDIALGPGGAEIGAALKDLEGAWKELQHLASLGGGLP